MARGRKLPPAPVVLGPGEGRHYDLGAMRAVFKADGAETGRAYSISEWWLEPRTAGPGAHHHAEDDLFYVLEGTAHVRVGDTWHEAPRGAFVLVPGGVTHDFENRGDVRTGLLNLSFPGGFEEHMPAIVDWFREHRPRPGS
jgi:mannose-6-phosphate isomerase-like protein (cupin superfamily)